MKNAAKTAVPIANTNTNKGSKNGTSHCQNRIRHHAAKCHKGNKNAQTKQMRNMKIYIRRSVLIPHKQLQTI